GLDIGSAGFRPDTAGCPDWQHILPQSWRSITAMIADPEAKECGFGYETCRNIFLHSPEAYEGTRCKDPERLRNFIHDNIYLLKSRFDYRKIESEFSP